MVTVDVSEIDWPDDEDDNTWAKPVAKTTPVKATAKPVAKATPAKTPPKSKNNLSKWAEKDSGKSKLLSALENPGGKVLDAFHEDDDEDFNGNTHIYT
jgi:hypothetical protein